MTEPPLPLTALSEAQRAQAYARFTIIRSALEEGVSQAQIVRTHNLPPSTVQRWVKHYQEKGLAGLANATRSDKGKPRSVPEQAIQLIEGLALQTPSRSAASIHRQVTVIAKEQGWKPPSYERVHQIIKHLDPALMTLAQQGPVAYREEFDLLYHHQAMHANAIWQADHILLDVWLLNEQGKPARPWLSVIEDDYSRAIVGYRFSFQEPTALTTALVLRQAIWRKEDSRWHCCGIPSTFYTDHGSDFASRHLEQVAADLKIELIFSEASVSRRRGKIARFFKTMNRLFLSDISGYAQGRYEAVKAELSLSTFEQQFRTWLLEDYHHQIHSQTRCSPAERWEAEGFLPRMPDSLERLDLLLLTAARMRRVQRDGIYFKGRRYLDPLLADYVKKEVLIRYDPVDMAEIRVFYQDRFLCRAVCSELFREAVSLKEIKKARIRRSKQIRAELSARATIVEQFVAVHQEDAPPLP